MGNFRIGKALLDFGASVNLLPCLVYEQLSLGKWKPMKITLQLANRSIKKLRGEIEDMLIQIYKFYFPVVFIILGTQPMANPST